MLKSVIKWGIILVFVGFVAVFSFFFIGSFFVKTDPPGPSDLCINNLRQIDAAANEFALEHNLTNGSLINFPNDLTPYIHLDTRFNPLKCPSGGTYKIAHFGDTPTCSLGTNVTPAHVLQ